MMSEIKLAQNNQSIFIEPCEIDPCIRPTVFSIRSNRSLMEVLPPPMKAALNSVE
jgi:hypothetical protein